MVKNGEIKDYYGPAGEVIIPSIINGEIVTSIGYRAFSEKSLTAVTIPSTITTIKEKAFESNALASVHFSEGLEHIGKHAFLYNSLESISSLPSTLQRIDSWAFRYNATEFLTLPTPNVTGKWNEDASGQSVSVHHAGNYVYLPNEYTPSDEDFRIVGGVITNYYGKPGKISIPNTVQNQTVVSIGSSAFNNAYLSGVILPNTISSIGNYAFKNNYLEYISVPENVRTIGKEAFLNNKLTNVVLPQALFFVGSGAFNINQLNGMSLPTKQDAGQWNNGNIIDKSSLVDHVYLFDQYTGNDSDFEIRNGEITDYYGGSGNITIPGVIHGQIVRKLGYRAFYQKVINQVNLPNSLYRISSSAFSDLENITLPIHNINGEWNEGNAGEEVSYSRFESYIFIAEDYTPTDSDFKFQYNEIINYFGPGGNITIPSKVNGETILSIGFFAFGDSELTSVLLPNSIRYIESAAFCNNNFSQKITLPTDALYISNDSFEGRNSTKSNLPSPTIDGHWNQGVNGEEIAFSEFLNSHYYIANQYTLTDNDVLVIDGKLIKYFGPSGSLIIPNSLDGQVITTIASGAFHIDGITNIQLPNSLIIIEPGSIGYHWYGNGNTPTYINIDLPETISFIADSNAISTTYEDLPKGVLDSNPGYFKQWYTWNSGWSNDHPNRINFDEPDWFSFFDSLNPSNSESAIQWGGIRAHLFLIDYYIKFFSADNLENESMTYTIESGNITLPTPTEDEYTFEGWYTEPTFDNTITIIPSGSTGNRVVYAKWGEDPIASLNDNTTDFSVYPNPCTNILFIENPKKNTVELIDVGGHSFTKKIINQIVDINDLPFGLYTIKVGQEYSKIIIQ